MHDEETSKFWRGGGVIRQNMNTKKMLNGKAGKDVKKGKTRKHS